LLDSHLSDRQYLVAGEYSIVDMDAWGWARMVPFILGEDAWAKFPNLKNLVDRITARPAAVRAVALKDKFPFKAEMDADARAHLFRHLAVQSAH
jgi:GSH-dependent disulfide-bond oxidoreductase